MLRARIVLSMAGVLEHLGGLAGVRIENQNVLPIPLSGPCLEGEEDPSPIGKFTVEAGKAGHAAKIERDLGFWRASARRQAEEFRRAPAQDQKVTIVKP